MGETTFSFSVIPFVDLRRQYQQIRHEVLPAMVKVCESAAFAGGPFVAQFEERFASYCGVPHCKAVNSGTSALYLAMRALDIGAGDEVIVPANTFIATAWAPCYTGAQPVFVDCDPETWNIDPSAIEGKITRKTKAIIGVHLYGQPFDVDAVREIADKYAICLVEDAAQAHGARYKGMRVGRLGVLGCFSFYPGKNLGAFGEGGGVTTHNAVYAKRIAALRDHASTQKYHHDELGCNMRMDGLQAAILSVKLRYLDAWNRRRIEIAAMYQHGISNPLITMQKRPQRAESVYHLFVITTEYRSKLRHYLLKHGIYTGMHYPIPCHLQKAFAYLGHKEGDFPHSERLARCCISLPMFPELADAEVTRVIDVINSYREH